MIHFFDLARWLLGEEPIEVFAMASCMVDPAIREAGDVDTSMVLMKNGKRRPLLYQQQPSGRLWI